MPSYPGNALATLLRNNQQAYLWNNESVPASGAQGSLSVAFQLERINRSSYPWGAAFEVIFSANPGVFEIDIVGCNNDNQQNYTFLGNITAATSYFAGSYVGRWDMPSNIWVKYVAGYMKTLTNAVNTTLQVTH